MGSPVTNTVRQHRQSLPCAAFVAEVAVGMLRSCGTLFTEMDVQELPMQTMLPQSMRIEAAFSVVGGFHLR